MTKSPNQEDSATICDSDLRIGYGANQAMLRDGANPTGTRSSTTGELTWSSQLFPLRQKIL